MKIQKKKLGGGGEGLGGSDVIEELKFGDGGSGGGGSRFGGGGWGVRVDVNE